MTRSPEFIVFTGPMMSSKTTRLIGAVDRLRYKNHKILAFKPRMDRRYTENDINTHNGGKISATVVSSGDEILRSVELYEPDVVAVDEAFMIDGSASALITLFRRGITILVSSIEMSAHCNIFPEIEKILPWATKIEKCTAVCVVCGEDAHYTQKKVNDLTEIAVGGSELYEPRCWHHHSSIKEA